MSPPTLYSLSTLIAPPRLGVSIARRELRKADAPYLRARRDRLPTAAQNCYGFHQIGRGPAHVGPVVSTVPHQSRNFSRRIDMKLRHLLYSSVAAIAVA